MNSSPFSSSFPVFLHVWQTHRGSQRGRGGRDIKLQQFKRGLASLSTACHWNKTLSETEGLCRPPRKTRSLPARWDYSNNAAVECHALSDRERKVAEIKVLVINAQLHFGKCQLQAKIITGRNGYLWSYKRPELPQSYTLHSKGNVI